jgi:DNA methylase
MRTDVRGGDVLTAQPLDDYRTFLAAKVVATPTAAAEVAVGAVHPLLKRHQAMIVRWMVQGGQRACFAAFGLGKTFVQLEAVRLTLEREGGRGLIVIPLGVRQEFMRDAATLGIAVRFIRSIDEAGETGIYMTNYETVRDGKLDPRLFTVASLDEASVLRGFGGTKTFREFMRLFAGDGKALNERTRGTAVPFRFVATATPSPNDYIELLSYAAFLGVMDVGAAKTRFFKRDSTKADVLTLHPHKEAEFWHWVATWAVFIQKPSDLCDCLCHSARTSSGFTSASSSSSDGRQARCGTAHGCVAAIAEASGSQPRITSSQGESSAAAADVLSTAGRAPRHMPRGGQCSTALAATGSTSSEVSPCATGGSDHSHHSSPTWGNRLAEELSTGSTTAETTNPETAAGRLENSRRATPAGTSGSPSVVASRPSLSGLKNSEPTTSLSTAAIASTAGPQSDCSPASCNRCRELDHGYDLPELDVRWHQVATDHRGAGATREGQGRMFKSASLGVVEASREKRDSLAARIDQMRVLLDEDPDEHYLIWHDLEVERHAIQAAVPDVVTVFGSQDLDQRERHIVEFSNGGIKRFAGKPVMLGSGCNFQRHCHRAIFLGIGFKFSDFIQAVHRIHRFLQNHRVRIDLIYTEAEAEVRRTLERKWQQHKELVANMTEIIRKYGLSHAEMARELTRAMGVERVEIRGKNYMIANNDCVEETKLMADGSVGLILTSIPFSTQYEYSPNYADFGHTDNNEHFFRQMDFLTPELLRVLQPGRIAAIHVKDRIVPGGMTGLGFQVVYPFHARCIEHYTSHGFAYMGMKTIVTDVVRENNQTYRLGWTEQCKDGTKMGVGMPEYLLLFRKPPTDNSNSYADTPVVKAKERYSRSRWQIDAHGFTRSSGDRPLTAGDFVDIPHERIFKLFREYSLRNVYDFEHHVRLGEALELRGRLPVTFMLLQPPSWHPDVWTDVTRMLTLNGAQSAKGREMHLCPMQFDLADRVIEQMSNPGDEVYDPFGGLMTVVVRAILKGRRGRAAELSTPYFLDGAAYCRAAEDQVSMPTLFALTGDLGAEGAA